MERCSGINRAGTQCGMYKDHTGPHSQLMPSNAAWFPSLGEIFMKPEGQRLLRHYLIMREGETVEVEIQRRQGGKSVVYVSVDGVTVLRILCDENKLTHNFTIAAGATGEEHET